MHKAKSSSRLMFISLIIFLVSGIMSFLATTQFGTVRSLLMVTPGTPPATHASATAAVAPTPTPTSLPEEFTRPIAKIILARDTFQRPDQTGWGHTTNLIKWEGGPITDPAAFSIKNSRGMITGQNATGAETYFAYYQTATTYDMEVLQTYALSNVRNNSLGTLFRWQDTDNWYGARFDGKHIFLEKRVNGVTSLMQTAAFSAIDNRVYILRVLVIKAFIAVKIWPRDEPEPEQWPIFAEDHSLEKGFGAIYAQLHMNVQASVFSYTTSGVYT